MRVLVVDDDTVFREEFAGFLSDEGHSVEAVPSVAKALEVLEAGPFDLIFTDLKMPRQSGLDLLRAVRERWPGQFVVMLTGYATVATAVEAMKLGAFDYVGKPFRTDQVRKVLDLVREELAYSGPRFAAEEPLALAERIGRDEHLPVLLAAPPPPPAALPHGITFTAFDGREPSRLYDEVEGFLRGHPRAAVVLPHLELALAGHRTEDIVAWLGRLRELLHDHGLLAVGFDPSRVPAAQVQAVREVLAASIVHGTLEALASPIRRRIVRRLAEGPAAFGTLMHAADLDDSPKMSFHLHRLVDEGLIVHAGEEYRLTPAGTEATELLRTMETSVGAHTQGTLLFQPGRGARRAGPADAARAGH